MDAINQILPKFKGYLIPLTIMLSFGLILYACSETQNPVSESTLTQSFSLPASSAIGVNTDPVVIQNFKITFNENESGYDEGNDQTTFNYTVTRLSDAEGFNYMAFEIPACAAYAGHTPSSSSSVTDDEIRWTSSIGTGSSRIHTVTYKGEISTGMINATIQGSGSGDTETKLIPGPCKGITTINISGAVYVDENADSTRNSGEGGIDNVTVYLENLSTTTNSKGKYEFNDVLAIKGYVLTLEVPEDPKSSLFENFTLTQGADGQPVTVGNNDVEDINFGFKPDTDGIITKFNADPEDPDGIKLQTEKPRFWAREYKFAERGPPTTLFEKTELLGFLDAIDELDLTYKFDFGTGGDNRIKKAEQILTIRGNSTELDELRAELLAAALNVVSGGGAVEQACNVLVKNECVQLDDFNILILKVGAAAVVAQSNNGSSLMMKSTTEVISTDSITSLSLSGDLITSFNGGGGGIGDQ